MSIHRMAQVATVAHATDECSYKCKCTRVSCCLLTVKQSSKLCSALPVLGSCPQCWCLAVLATQLLRQPWRQAAAHGGRNHCMPDILV